jgi:hypothetical protein
VTARYIHHVAAALISAADAVSSRICAAFDGQGAEIINLAQKLHAA